MRQRSFHPGQIYVALSRVTSLDGLYLTGTYSKSAIKADNRAHEQYNYMREHCILKPVHDFGPVDDTSLTITLLNTRSLLKHCADIIADPILMESDVLCLTETQIFSSFEYTFPSNDFQLIQNNSDDRFCSIAIGYVNSIIISHVTNIPGASLFRVSKTSFYPSSLNLLLIYRKNSLSQADSLEMVRRLMDISDSKIDIIMGDFNKNALSIDNYFERYLSDYEQIVEQPTHISGSLIDHVYVHRSFRETLDVKTFVKNVYFSDHDAIKIRIRQM